MKKPSCPVDDGGVRLRGCQYFYIPDAIAYRFLFSPRRNLEIRTVVGIEYISLDYMEKLLTGFFQLHVRVLMVSGSGGGTLEETRNCTYTLRQSSYVVVAFLWKIHDFVFA